MLPTPSSRLTTPPLVSTCCAALCHGHAHFGTVNASAFEVFRLLRFFLVFVVVCFPSLSCLLSPSPSLSLTLLLVLGFYLSSINIATCHLCHFSLCLVLFHLAFSSCLYFFLYFLCVGFPFLWPAFFLFFHVVCGTRSVSAYLLVLFAPAASASVSASPSASNLFLIYKFFMRCFDNALTTLPTNESLNNYKAAAQQWHFFAFSTLRFYAMPTVALFHFPCPYSASLCPLCGQPGVESVSNAILLFML